MQLWQACLKIFLNQNVLCVHFEKLVTEEVKVDHLTSAQHSIRVWLWLDLSLANVPEMLPLQMLTGGKHEAKSLK